MEWIWGVYFTIDYLVRLLTARVWYRWMYRMCKTQQLSPSFLISECTYCEFDRPEPFNIVDLVSTAPFWIDLALKGIVKRLAVLRVLRLLRIFRVLRAAKKSPYLVVSKRRRTAK